MEFKKGELIKPKHTTANGTVLFTNGTEDCDPNEISCRAYGYTWDKNSNTCVAFPANQLLTVMENTLKVGNKQNGVRNEIKEGSYYNDINGVENKVDIQVQNSEVNGRGNEIVDNIHNASVSGAYGKVIRQAEAMQGGGNLYDDKTAGQVQTSVIQLTCITEDAEPTNMKVQGTDDIAIQANSILGWELYITALVTVITGGECTLVAGNYTYSLQRGSAAIDNDSIASFCAGTQDLICREGEEMPSSVEVYQLGSEFEGWGDLSIAVEGSDCATITWHAVMTLHETKSNGTF